MTSLLVLTSAEKLQNEINSAIKSFRDIPGVYVSLNKSQKSIENILRKAGINTDELFFIDCVTTEKTRSNVLHIAPDQLHLLSPAIHASMENIKGEKFLIVDALYILLTYNNENDVAKFVKAVTEYASRDDVKIVAFSYKTGGGELLNKIFSFFDNVEKR